MMKKENRGHLMMVKLTDGEWQQLQNKAKSFNLPVSAYVRMMLLSAMGEAFRTTPAPVGEAFRTTPALLGEPYIPPPAPLTDADRDAIIEALKEHLEKNGNKGAKKK